MINTVSVLTTCERGDLRGLHRILRSHKNINVDFEDSKTNSTALHFASKAGDLPIVKLLLAYGAKVNRRMGANSFLYFGDTPLSIALAGKKESVIEELLRHKAKALPVGYFGNRKTAHPDAYVAKESTGIEEVLNEDERELFEREYKVLPKQIIEQNIETDSCAVCLGDFKQTPATIVCGHKFHLKCLLQWDLNSNTAQCPLCRTKTRREIFK